MPRREQVRRRVPRPDQEPGLPALPRRPISDTQTVRALLERIRRVLDDSRR